MAESRGQFGKAEEDDCMPLEAFTRELVKTKQAEKT